MPPKISEESIKRASGAPHRSAHAIAATADCVSLLPRRPVRPGDRLQAVIEEYGIAAHREPFSLPEPNGMRRRVGRMTAPPRNCTPVVPCVQELDLSHNNISRIEGLETLDELKRLVRVSMPDIVSCLRLRACYTISVTRGQWNRKDRERELPALFGDTPS